MDMQHAQSVESGLGHGCPKMVFDAIKNTYIGRPHSQDVTGQVQTKRNSLDTVGISGLAIAKRKAATNLER